MEYGYKDQVRVYKAFCDENRLKVLEMLREGEKCACKLLENLQCSQSSLSYHMKVLVESGIVTNRQDGKWTYYRIDPAYCSLALTWLQQITTLTGDPDQLDCCSG